MLYCCTWAKHCPWIVLEPWKILHIIQCIVIYKSLLLYLEQNLMNLYLPGPVFIKLLRITPKNWLKSEIILSLKLQLKITIKKRKKKKTIMCHITLYVITLTHHNHEDTTIIAMCLLRNTLYDGQLQLTNSR